MTELHLPGREQLTTGGREAQGGAQPVLCARLGRCFNALPFRI